MGFVSQKLNISQDDIAKIFGVNTFLVARFSESF